MRCAQHRQHMRGCRPCQVNSASIARRLRHNPPSRPLSEVRPHVQELLKTMTIGAVVAEARGRVSRKTVSDISLGVRTRGVYGPTADTLLAIRPTTQHNRLQPSVGTARKIQAMAVMGMTIASMVERSGVCRATIVEIRCGRQTLTRPNVIDAIDTLYQAACADHIRNFPSPMVPGGSQRTRDRALAAGWLDAMAWDEDTIDDPEALPNVAGVDVDPDDMLEATVADAMSGRMRHTQLNRDERVEVVRRLVMDGHSYTAIGRVLNWPPGPADGPGKHSAVQQFACRYKITHTALGVAERPDEEYDPATDHRFALAA